MPVRHMYACSGSVLRSFEGNYIPCKHLGCIPTPVWEPVGSPLTGVE